MAVKVSIRVKWTRAVHCLMVAASFFAKASNSFKVVGVLVKLFMDELSLTMANIFTMDISRVTIGTMEKQFTRKQKAKLR